MGRAHHEALDHNGQNLRGKRSEKRENQYSIPNTFAQTTQKKLEKNKNITKNPLCKAKLSFENDFT